MTTHKLNIERARLQAIRYLAWIAEGMSSETARSPLGPERRRMVCMLCDCIEHIAQYALEDVADRAQASYIMDDVLRMQALIERGECDFEGNAPSLEDLKQLHADCMALGGRQNLQLRQNLRLRQAWLDDPGCG